MFGMYLLAAILRERGLLAGIAGTACSGPKTFKCVSKLILRFDHLADCLTYHAGCLRHSGVKPQVREACCLRLVSSSSNGACLRSSIL